MASISKEKNGHRTIQFMAIDGKRKSIRLGKMPQKAAEAIKTKVELIIAAVASKTPLDQETAKWLGEIPDGLHDKLGAVGLSSSREQKVFALGDFLNAYMAKRTDLKPSTVCNLNVCKARLVEFFGSDKDIRTINVGHAKDWEVWLKERYAKATVGRTIRRAKQFFQAAIDKDLIHKSPFAKIKPPGQANETRKFFISLEAAYKVLEACPDAEWRLLFALSRFGGLRCPSEHLTLRWADVDWERDRFRVTSPKKEHLDDGGVRWVPIFPELRPYLEEAFELAPVGTVYVINRYRDTKTNLRTQLQRIIKSAGLERWPKLWQNLRATRETELAEVWPLHVVTAWIGNTATIAQKHYLQVTDEHFKSAAESGARVVQNPVQQAAVCSSTESQEMQKSPEKPGSLQSLTDGYETVQLSEAPRVGLEPTIIWLTAAVNPCIAGSYPARAPA
jgi:integrase